MRVFGTLAATFCLLLIIACGGSSSNSGTSTITTVGSSCSPTAITSGQTSQCTSTVSGTGSFSNSVSWTASGGGTISSGGVFTAGTVPFTTQVTITATSTQDTTKAGSTTITVAAAGAVTGVTAVCSPSSIQTGQLTSCTATVQGNGNFSPNVDWSASGGTINPITGVFSSATAGNFTITANSQQNPQVTGSATVSVATAANNQAAIIVDAGPTGNYVNGAFTTVTVCTPNTTTCQTIDHVLVDTGSTGLRLLAQGTPGGLLDPTAFPLQTDSSNNPIAECNQFLDGFSWGSVALATIQLAQASGGLPGETASTVPGATVPGVPIQIIGDPRVPGVPASCTATGADESNLNGLGAYGVLGIGNFMQDCGPGCVSNSPIPNVYYSCSGGSCNATLVGLPQQMTNPVWVLPTDNNGVLIQLPPIPAGGTANVVGKLVYGIGTQSNNVLGSATVFDTDANAFFNTTFNGQQNACSFIDSGSNAYYFPASGFPNLTACASPNSGFYCPPVALSPLVLNAQNQSASNTNGASGTVNFNVGNANTLFSNNGGQNTAFIELGGSNAPINGCGSFDWGLSFFYGKSVFTAIEQQTVSGTSYVGPFWAY